MKGNGQEPIVEDREKLIRAELETLSEEELKERLKKPLPPWAWVFPIVFGFLGGLGTWIAFSGRRGAGWLFVVGILVQVISAVVISAVY